MLDKFIECLCNDNLEALVISGNPPKEVLQATWDDLHLKYVEIIGGEDVQDRIKLIKEIAILTFNIERIEALLEVLAVAPTEGLFNQLYNLDYTLPQLPYNQDSIQILTKRITAFMKRDVVEIKELTARINEGSGESKKQTEADFYNMIAEIGDAFKIVLKEQETSVMTFAVYLNKYRVKVEQINRQNMKNSTI
jgi:hypothetical protein